ncbi:hypothetical protein ACFV7R_26835 [Streptomyces sp. NPDC059866]
MNSSISRASSSKTHSWGTSSRIRSAYARSAAVCEAIVWSFFCRCEDTLP